jgi:UDP-glucose 4-epimerase
VDESNHVDPLSPHAVAKLAGEMYLRAYAEMYGLAPICLALANVYGVRIRTARRV